MRLLFVISKYFEYGGLQRDMLRLARAAKKRGADVTILCGSWEGERPEDVPLLVEPLTAVSNEGRNLELSRRIRILRSERGLDAVVGFHKLDGIDVYYGGDTCFAEKFERNKPKWFRLLPRYRRFLELEKSVFGRESSTEILLLTPGEIPLYEKHYQTQRERCHLLPPGIDRERLIGNPWSSEQLLALRREAGLEANTKVLLHVGSDFKRKGIDRCIRSVAALPESLRSMAALVVLGQDESAPYKQLARELGVNDRIHFLGGRKEVAAFYQMGELLLHPAYVETAGMVLLEAMVCGLPVICSGACGYAFHIERAGGGMVLPEPFSQDRLNEAVTFALTNDTSEWREKARHYASTEELDGMVPGALDVIFARAEKNRASKNLKSSGPEKTNAETAAKGAG